jgi:hypothetical protein
VKGSEFPRKLHALGKVRGVAVSFDTRRGKGSHGRVYYGSVCTALKDRNQEIGSGLPHKMCRDPGIDPSDL